MSQIIADTLKLIADNQDVILSAMRLAATKKRDNYGNTKDKRPIGRRLGDGEWEAEADGLITMKQ